MRQWAEGRDLHAFIEIALTSFFLFDTKFLCLYTLNSCVAAVQLLLKNSQQLKVTGDSTFSNASLSQFSEFTSARDNNAKVGASNQLPLQGVEKIQVNLKAFSTASTG